MYTDKSGAIFSPCWKYRYRLWRRWNFELPTMAFVMLNPSTADAEKDDNTIRRCIGFAKAEYYGGIEVVNLFAWRATKPADLWKAADPVGPDNDSHLRAVVGTARMIVCAWGSNAARQPERAKHVRDLLHYYMPLHYLQLTKDGIPCHPLMLPKSCEPMLWEFEF